MKTNRVSRLLFALALASIFIATWSCNDDDGPSLQTLREDRLQFLQDSLRISDSLRLINNAGVVNYAITVVDGSSSSIFANDGSRTEKTQTAITGAVVTISQYGKTLKDTTDGSGMVVFKGFFRSAVNVTVEAAGFTKVSYISALNRKDSTGNGTIVFVGNLIPLFATSGPTTATISGVATIETDLTNRTKEFVADGTTLTATIDASINSDFSDKFLTTDLDFFHTSTCGCEIVYVGDILQASYQTGSVGTVSSTPSPGSYSMVVPAAVDGLPINLQYSDVAADQTLFQLDGDDQSVITTRVVFTADPLATAAALPASGDATVSFVSHGNDDGDPSTLDAGEAQASAVISDNTGTLANIIVTNGGLNYNGTPLVEITSAPGDTGSGATATATVGANGRVTGVTITSPGTGYTLTPSVSIISGSGATASTVLAGTGTVVAINLLTTGEGYTGTPTVDITGGGATTNATATATVANGRVTGITLVTGGVGYDGSAITVVLTGGAPTTPATASAVFSGRGIGNVTLTGGGADYTYAPVVQFTAPQMPTGVRPTAVASFDPDTRQVTGINVTSSGSGYTAPPTITLTAGTGATAQAFLTGGSVISFDVFDEGAEYAYAPTVIVGRTFTGNGTGATGTAVMSDGRVVGITVTNPGTGYTSAPSVEIVSGSGAVAYPVVNASGSVTGYTVTRGGSGYAGAPRVVISSSGIGFGATATAAVAGGAVTGVTAVLTGSNYEAGNTPSSAQGFSTTKGSFVETKPSISIINDVKYGTGTIRD